MTNDYLPKNATIEQACAWLHARTGETWVLSRLLECHLRPHFWLDYAPGYPQIFGDRIEGYQTRMVFQGDLCRLESDGADALVNMYESHDGSLLKSEPGLRVPLTELRFKREAIERVAEIVIASKQPAPVAGHGKRWTPENLAKMKTYRETHTMPETASKFSITEQRIRQLLPSKKPRPTPFAGLVHRMK